MKNNNGNNVELLVHIFTRPNLRCESDEFLMYQGQQILRNIFDERVVNTSIKEIYLHYPERWTNIIEQRMIYGRILQYYPNVEKIKITTHSVYIVQCTESACCRICDDASKYPENTEGATCPNSVEPGLMIFSGKANA